MNFYEKLQQRWDEGAFVCVGLDPVLDKIPWFIHEKKVGAPGDIVLDFNKSIIDHTHQYACAFKPNTAFYEALGYNGLYALQRTIEYASRFAPVICDAKRGDIAGTNDGYVKAIFSTQKADAITIAPYMGREANKPFLDCSGKGIIVLVRTSNKGAGEFQDLVVKDDDGEERPLYQLVAKHVAKDWNYNHNCAVVVGATYPEELRKVREIIGDEMPILIPGVGAQGGDLEAAVRAGVNSKGEGIIVNASRSILYAYEKSQMAGVKDAGFRFAKLAGEEAKLMNDAINSVRR